MHLLPILWLIGGIASLSAQGEAPFGIPERIPWTTSRVAGSPDPPLPFTTGKVFTEAEFKAPIYVTPEPGSNFLFVVLQGGEKDRPSKVARVPDRPNASELQVILQLTNRLIYSVQPHPGYRTNGWLFVFSNGPTPESERTNRVSRFTVRRDQPFICDPQSEQRIIEWRSAGHDGGDMAFARDGTLFLSTGDGTSDSDGWNSGQTVDDLLGSVLRIDPGRGEGTNAYTIPRDNPFYGRSDARGEIWAYGLRNPWRMSLDLATGQLWVGNNGQDLWETAHLIRPGENYGWSVYEGSYPFYLNRKRGPTPVVLPTIEHPHSEMRSLTGGVVYYGNEFPEIGGSYIYGDYATGQIWAARHDGAKLIAHRKLAQTQLQIAAFSLDHHGGLLIVDHGGAIHRLLRNPHAEMVSKFPQRLSETGLFASTASHAISPGVIPYSVNSPGWFDGAHAERFIGLPGLATMDYTPSEGKNFTNGTVFVQTLSFETETGNPASRKRIETRILTRQTGLWAGYSYRWDGEEKDATLVPARGEDVEIGAGSHRRTWRFPSRNECMACHSRASNFVLGLNEAQMHREHDYGAVRDNQLRTLSHIGLFTRPLDNIPEARSKLVDPYDETAEVEARARSYLHVNCSMCHMEAGGGNAMMELGIGRDRDKMRLIGARPQHDSFGIDNAMLVSPGDPGRSVLLVRLSRRGRGQMPPVAVRTVDTNAVALFKEWISRMPPEHRFVKEWQISDLLPLLPQLSEKRSLESGRRAYEKTGCAQCHRFGSAGGSVGPDLTGSWKKLGPQGLLESILTPSKMITDGYATTEIETRDDQVVSGFIEREDSETIVLRVPGNDRPISIARQDVLRRRVSALSNMPSGIANSLTEDQILDLLAYLRSDGTVEDR